MYNAINFRRSLIPILTGGVSVLVVVYIGLIAIIMSYAALTVEFSQSVRNDEATVAELESTYLRMVAYVSNIDYASEGYTKPSATIFVPAKSVTAHR